MESLGGWPVIENKNWNDRFYTWQSVLLKLELMGFSVNCIFEGSVDVDMRNSTKKSFYVSFQQQFTTRRDLMNFFLIYFLQIDQPTLGVDRDYLIKGMDSDIVQAYHKYQIDTAIIYGADKSFAESEMKDVLNFEIEIAKISTPKEERRNMTLLYNPISIREFQHIYPIHDWVYYDQFGL
jgi:predicted metalloendopeptidase